MKGLPILLQRIPHKLLRLLAASVLTVTLFSSLIPSAVGQDSDSRFLAVSRKVPEFGGAYVTEGSVHLWLTKPTDELRDLARTALIEVVGVEFDTRNVVVLKAAYSFEQLYRWHDAAVGVLSIEGVVYTDINERTNHLEVGAENPVEQKASIEAKLSESEVPRAAVDIVKADPIYPVPNSQRKYGYLLGAAVGIIVAAGLLLRRVVSSRRRAMSTDVASRL